MFYILYSNNNKLKNNKITKKECYPNKNKKTKSQTNNHNKIPKFHNINPISLQNKSNLHL